MSYKELVKATEGLNGSEAPVFGGAVATFTDEMDAPGQAIPASGFITRVRYYIANMEDPSDCSFVEDIMSRSITSMNCLTKAGDISVFREDTNFTKDGRYIVAIKYSEAMSPNSVM